MNRGDKPSGVALDSHNPVAQQAYRGVNVDSTVDMVQVVFDAYVTSPAGAAVLTKAIL